MTIQFIKKLLVPTVTIITSCIVSLNSDAHNTPCPHSNNTITLHDVIAAQKQWSQGLLAIGQAYRDHKDYVGIARDFISKQYTYDYEKGIVLFKPTKAQDAPFRRTATAALSYFTGNNTKYQEDSGFALKPWTKITFQNDEMYFHDDIAIAMGEYYFSQKSAQPIKVEYTFGYVKDEQGQVRIFLQHSSLPYQKSA